VKIIPELSATRYMAFKVIRSNIEIAITPPWMARLRSNLVQCFTSQMIHCKCSRSKVKGQDHSDCCFLRRVQLFLLTYSVMYQQQNAIIWQWIGSATVNVAWHRN